MKNQYSGCYFPRAIALITLAGLSFPGSVSAQIIPDTTLGREASIASPTLINGIPSDQVDGGALRGRNLFHSFQEFNIGEGRGAYFTNPIGVENILSRVTGNNPSHLMGKLGVLGNANLFLINPNGILFGPNAGLDIRGSFIASTADHLTFDNGFVFSASDPQAPPLLTINVPLGLQYGTRQAGNLINQGNLTVGRDLILSGGSVNSTGVLNAPNGTLLVRSVTGDTQVRHLHAQTATLAAAQDLLLSESQLTTSGNLTLQADNAVTIRDSATHPFIAQAGGMLTVQGERAVDIFALNHPNSGLWAGGDLVLRSNEPISGDAYYFTNGSFRAEQLDGSPQDLFSPYDPLIISSEGITIQNYVGASLHILTAGRVNILGTVVITGPDNSLGGGGEAGFFTINPFHSNPTIRALSTVSLPDGSAQVINGRDSPTLDIRAGIDPAIIAALTPVPFFDAATVPNTPPVILINGTNYINAPPSTVLGTSPVMTADINIGAVRINAPDGTVLITNRDLPSGITGGNIAINIGIDTSSTIGNGGLVTVDSRAGLTVQGLGINTSSDGGNAGAIRLFSANDTTVNAPLNTSSLNGAGGAIQLQSTQGNLILNSNLDSRSNAGNAGNIQLRANNGQLTMNGSNVQSGTLGGGAGGDINIQAAQVSLLNGATLSTRTTGAGNAGAVQITTPALEITGNGNSTFAGGILAGSTGAGNAGDVTIQSGQIVLQNGARIDTTTTQTGQAGDVSLLGLTNLTIRDATITTETAGGGAAGDITVNAVAGSADISNSLLTVESRSAGAAGQLTITANNLTLRNAAQLSGNTTGAGPGGTVTLNANQANLQTNTQITTQTFATAQGGNVNINANQLTMQSGVEILANTGFNSTGNAGNITLNVTDSTDLAQSFLFANTNSSGNGGSIAINTRQLNVRDGTRFSVFSQGSGAGGSIAIAATESVDITGTDNLGLASGLYLGATSTGNAGSLDIDTQRLSIRAGGLIYATTTGSGQAGNLRIRATERLQVSGAGTNAPSGIVAETNNFGNAGTLNITTGQLLIQDGGNISAQTIGAGQAGNLTVSATQGIEVSGTSTDGRFRSRLFFDSAGSGNAGVLSVNTPNLTVLNGGQVSAKTANSGFGGILAIDASNSITVRGRAANGQASAIDFSSSGSGNAQGIRLNTSGQLAVQDGGQITVSGTGSGFSGDIEIQANTISMENQGRIQATTRLSEGGNIILRLFNPGISIWMQNNSEISAEAFGFANAGNLTIDTPGLIVSSSLADNNDVVANSIFGRGGRIDATASFILGFRQFQGNRTPESDFTSRRTDSPPAIPRLQLTRKGISIVSSSEFDGSIAVNVQEPLDFPALPEDFLTNTVSSVCQPHTQQNGRSELVERGPGGIPMRPEDAMSSEAIAVGLVSPVASSEQARSHSTHDTTARVEIVEAQQLVKLADGTIALVGPSVPKGLPLVGCQMP